MKLIGQGPSTFIQVKRSGTVDFTEEVTSGQYKNPSLACLAGAFTLKSTYIYRHPKIVNNFLGF
jgi:hypothetical protein